MSETLEAWELWALKEKSHELDIHNGGHCDYRLGCVNFWSSLDNCPEGQETLIYLKGAIGYPRNYIGTVYFDDLSIDTINYERMRQEKGCDTYGEVKKSYVNQPEDIAWVRAQWMALWRKALPGVPAPELTIRKQHEGR